MARSNVELNRGANGGGNKNRATAANKFHTSPKYFKSITPPMKHATGEQSPQRLSPPVRVSTPPTSGSYSSSPRTSPGLLAGHYAGCKFTEPPLPSALPPPPQHWMQSPHFVLRPFSSSKQEPEQLAHQLKVLLKVQA